VKAFVQYVILSTVPKKSSTKINNTFKKDWGSNKGDVLQETIGIMLKNLPCLYCDGIKINCSDDKQRTGHPILDSWIADYKEYCTLFQVHHDSYVLCKIPKEAKGNNIKGPEHDNALYKEKFLKFLEIKTVLDSYGITRTQQQKLRAERNAFEIWFKIRRVHCADRILYNSPGMT